MTDNSTSASLVNLGELSKPVNTLIQKISGAVGGLFQPYQIKRIARAEAEAAIISAETEIHVAELKHRALHRFIEEEAIKQRNMEDITRAAIPLISETADTEKVDDDWLANFFDKSRIVSNSEMQQIWSGILASEANKPGSFAKKTINLVADLEKSDAKLFTKLCGFAWMIGKPTPIIFDTEDPIYASHGVNFTTISHLENMGLVDFNNLTGFRRTGLPDQFIIHYYGRPMHIELKGRNDLAIGKVVFTKAGHELAPICGSSPAEGFYDFVKNNIWKELQPVGASPTAQGATGPAS